MSELVSVIMPSYNTARFIGSTIESVLAQTYTNFEIIIVDDCSTDDTDKIVGSFDDRRIKYLKNEVNGGAAVCRNRALREAKGEYIAFLDSDDLWEKDKLELQIAFMKEKDAGFSYTEYREIDEDSSLLGRRVSGPSVISKRGMYRYCWPGCLTVMYDARRVGLIQIKDIKKNNDYAMWLKVARKEKCHLLALPLARYRRRAGSISNHGYTKLIKWHYRLFREADERCVVTSALFTLRNLFFGVIKKLKYVRKEEEI